MRRADERAAPVTSGRLLGRTIRLTAEPGIITEGGGGPSDPFWPPDSEPPGGPPAVHLHLVRSPAALTGGTRTEAAPVVVHDVTLPLRCVDDGAGPSWEVGDDSAGGRIRLVRGGASVVAWDAEARWASPVAVAAIRLLAMEAMRACGLVPLHAAVVARGDEGVALLGPSGAGKSTTLLRAVREGWVPVSEDLAWVDPATLEVARGDVGVRVWPDARDRYVPWLASLPWQPEPDGKTLLPFDALGAAPPVGVRLARVAVLSPAGQREDGPPDPLSPREMAVVLWEAAGFALVPANQRALGGHVARLVGQLRGERLPLGRLPRFG